MILKLQVCFPYCLLQHQNSALKSPSGGHNRVVVGLISVPFHASGEQLQLCPLARKIFKEPNV